MSIQRDLLQRISDAIRTGSGATALCFFGSLADGAADEFSDIDPQLSVSESWSSGDELLAALEPVAPVDLLYEMPQSD